MSQAKREASFTSPLTGDLFVLWAAQSLKATEKPKGPMRGGTLVTVWLLSTGASKETKKRTAGRRWQRGKWRAPVVSKSTSRLIQRESRWGRMLVSWGDLSETEPTVDKISYIWCLLKLNPPNPKATSPTNQREELWEPTSWWDISPEVSNLRAVKSILGVKSFSCMPFWIWDLFLKQFNTENINSLLNWNYSGALRVFRSDLWPLIVL